LSSIFRTRLKYWDPMETQRKNVVVGVNRWVRGLRPSRRTGDPGFQPRRSVADVRKLIVGREIILSGEITSCDKLIVEGSVEANLANCRYLGVAETGLFKGSASIEEAEIRGRFEGNLLVQKRLLIKAGGRVSGTIHYGEIEIECGGLISGNIHTQIPTEQAKTGQNAQPISK
jgi:cytoskeletal protein CcmA (bactofilin family)